MCRTRERSTNPQEEERMTPRTTSPVTVVPETLQPLLDVSDAIEKVGLPQQTLGLVHLRTSQVNGCAG